MGKVVYNTPDVEDDAIDETQTFDDDIPKEMDIRQNRKYTSSDHTVNVSINLTQPQYQTIHSLHRHIPMHSHSLSVKNNINNGSDDEIVILHKSNNKSKHYKNIPTEEDIEDIKLESLQQSDCSSSDLSHSEQLYGGSKAITNTTNGPNDIQMKIKRLDSMELLLSNSDPLPEYSDDDIMDNMMSNEGVDIVFSEWILCALKECAPINEEWKIYWKNFKDNNINKDTLKYLNSNKERNKNEWIQLIPKIGPRIQFQQMLHDKLSKNIL